MRMKNEPPKQKVNQVAEAMVRWDMILGGTVASSFFQNWIAINAMIRIPKTTKRAMIRPKYR